MTPMILLLILSFLAGCVSVWFWWRSRQRRTQELVRRFISGKAANIESLPPSWKETMIEIELSRIRPERRNPAADKDTDKLLTETRRKHHHLQLMSELGRQITASLNLEEVFHHVSETIVSMMNAQVVELDLYSSRDDRWTVFSNHPGTTRESGYRNHLAAWSLENRKEILLTNAPEQYGRYVFSPLDLPGNERPVSIICIPLIRMERPIGTLCVMSFMESSFGQEQAEMLRDLAPYLTVAVENAQVHEELQIMQEQLIHNEKMASLGSLTAGIAHEIQNPLNFVNNFSESSMEMMDELLEAKDDSEKAGLMSDLKDNLGRILHHGRRADSIVKSMLLHSRSGTAEKQVTDLNKICEEYMVLAYHGLRAKENRFECQLIRKFDPDLPPVSVYPQDIGRVLMNLLNNAFYAVNEKRRKLEAANVRFNPEITVTTQTRPGQVRILIRDNGSGIPEEYFGKIFQPFFTTKPTGEGTGLGLSMSHDIVHKGHQGELTVQSRPGEFTEFTIALPLR